jgi:hypothetical protein
MGAKLVNGFGTAFYGKKINRNNNSYIATKWLVFFYLPIVPLGTYSLSDSQEKFDINFSGLAYSKDVRSEKIKLDLKQVFSVYVVMLFVLCTIILCILFKAQGAWILSGLLFLGIILFIFFLLKKLIAKIRTWL